MWIRRKKRHLPDPLPPTYASSNQNGARTSDKSFVGENRPDTLTSVNKSYLMSWSSGASAAVSEADTSDATSLPSSSSLATSYGSGCWFEEEKAFPLKKRRNSLRRFTTTQLYSTPDKEIEKPIKTKQKSNHPEEENEDAEWRCKRNSGKGWRCRMRRMGGRAYCEHHVITRTLAYRGASRSGGVKMGNVKKNRGLEKVEEHKIGKMCKKKTRMMTIRSILDRAVPFIEEEV